MFSVDPFGFNDRSYFTIGPKTPPSALDRFKQPSPPTCVKILHGAKQWEQYLGLISGIETLLIMRWTRPTLDPIRAFRNLRQIHIRMSRGVRDISALAQIHTLETIDVFAGTGITSVLPLASLPKLARLRMWTLWGEYRLKSSEEFALLRRLEHLDLSGVRFRDGTIRALAKLPKLRFLRLSNWYPIEDTAWLAGRLSGVECSLFEPVAGEGSECKKCGRVGVQLSGTSRGCFRCTECDKEKIAAHIAKFEHIKSSAKLRA